ncbi:hypothetical protein SCH4B_4148 [Ruegeria sp. TrichCH4B]|nr:hypothetical protein SCH4B_4148 [Ruegeria sp. TrichCH4B]
MAQRVFSRFIEKLGAQHLNIDKTAQENIRKCEFFTLALLYDKISFSYDSRGHAQFFC